MRLKKLHGKMVFVLEKYSTLSCAVPPILEPVFEQTMETLRSGFEDGLESVRWSSANLEP